MAGGIFCFRSLTFGRIIFVRFFWDLSNVGSDERTRRPGGGTGRRAGLKILFAERRVRVRFPSGALKIQTGTRVAITAALVPLLFFPGRLVNCQVISFGHNG